MKKLREYIRQVILTEGMKTIDELPEGAVIVIKDFGPGGFSVSYAFRSTTTGELLSAVRAHGGPWGWVGVRPPSRSNGPCEGALNVANAEANKGWGPLLYDVAIERATQIANGLIPDRGSVSEAAERVWDYYLNNRSDVTAHQLDNLSNHLTYPPDDPMGRAPIDDDNCNQSVAAHDDMEAVLNTIFSSMGEESENNPKDKKWVESSLSKRYTKPPTTINNLKSKEKLVME